jgi:hypothetical protein
MFEPRGCDCHHRRIEASGRYANRHTKRQLEFKKRRRAACGNEAGGEERAPKQHNDARAQTVGHHAPQESSGAHAQEIESRGC